MNTQFKFSNIIGTVYHDGNLLFANDGVHLISPVGNKINIYGLKENRSETLPVESSFNFKHIALDASQQNILAVNERGEALFLNLYSRQVIFRHRFNSVIRCIKFSPDGRKFAVCRGSDVQIYRSPCLDFIDSDCAYDPNPFFLEDVYHVAQDENICLNWSDDSRIFAVGSKDMQTRICGGQRYENMFMYSLSGHTGPVLGLFFPNHNNFDLFSIDKNGAVVSWQCMIKPEELIPVKNPTSRSSDVVLLGGSEVAETGSTSVAKKSVLSYIKINRHTVRNAMPSGHAIVSAVDYHRKTKILVTGFANGSFAMFEMPNFSLIRSLSISEQPVKSVQLNASGDWLAVGCGGLGQMLVWEWQSETFVLKQQGHFMNLQCLAYSPDGHLVATGGEDGKVKVWSVKSGFCIVTFSEHTGGVTGVAWMQAGKAVVSCSQDGSVRAFDMKRYRNFRTFTATRQVQFSCLAIDKPGDVVCAGSQDHFDIYVWSVQSGRLLEIFSGHEAPVSSLHFNPIIGVLASSSWDKTVRIWDLFENKGSSEAISLQSEALDVKFSPNGQQIAVVSNDTNITFFNWRDGEQEGQIEGHFDLDPGRGEKELITPKTSGKSKSFSSVCYSADGAYVLAGGQSRYVCLYNVRQALIVKKFMITINLSLDSVADDIDRRKVSDFGSGALVDRLDSDDEETGGTKLKLPGVRSGDFGQRSHRPEARVFGVQFSPTGRSFACCSTEGLLVYSVDDVILFDPFEFSSEVSPHQIVQELAREDFSKALVTALRLNEHSLIVRCIEETPKDQIVFITRNLSLIFVERILEFLAGQLDRSRHLELYLRWINNLLNQHTNSLKSSGSSALPGVLASLQLAISGKQNELSKMCNFNKYSLSYIASVRSLNSNSSPKCLSIDVEKDVIASDVEESGSEDLDTNLMDI